MKKFFRGISVYLTIFVGLIIMLLLFRDTFPSSKELGYVELINEIESGNLKEITMVKDGTVKGALENGDNFSLVLPISSDIFYTEYIKELIDNNEVKLSGEKEPETSWLVAMLPTVVIILLLGVFWYIFMQQSQSGGSKVMSFGKTKVKPMEKDDIKIKFKDVAGLEEEKKELQEIVDFLKNPKKYTKLGARIPKGVLMVGPPGTGKTYITKAVAGEASVPFFSISGSDFVEMFVGVGASRVRDLFENAKKSTPCLVFIDEIDAIGKKRGVVTTGGHSEAEQTLNQLLVEMDGFEENKGIIIIGATNRADVLDPALLRPGRFDRQLYIGVPDIKGREEILKVHTVNKPLGEDVDLKVVARRTSGFTPADIENLTNEAALLAARENLTKIPMRLLEEASTKVVAGPEKRSMVVSEKERRLTAYHEGGHALVTRLLPDADPVHMVTIIPRGMAGGFTMSLPEEERRYMTKLDMTNQIILLLGGRLAEKIVLKDISTGAQNDLDRATKIARAMVTRYGMSDKLGNMTYDLSESDTIIRGYQGGGNNYSEEIAFEIDKEIRSIIDSSYEKAKKLIEENLEILHRLAESLLERETLNAEEFEMVYNNETLPPEIEIKEEKHEEINIEEINIEEINIEKDIVEEKPDTEVENTDEDKNNKDDKSKDIE